MPITPRKGLVTHMFLKVKVQGERHTTTRVTEVPHTTPREALSNVRFFRVTHHTEAESQCRHSHNPIPGNASHNTLCP